MAATVFSLQFPFTTAVPLFLFLGASCVAGSNTQLGLFHCDCDFSLLSSCGLHRSILHSILTFGRLRSHIMEVYSLWSQSRASRFSGKEAGVSSNGPILSNGIQVGSLSLPSPCGWHMKAYFEKEHFSSPNWPQAISVKWLSFHNKWAQDHSQY